MGTLKLQTIELKESDWNKLHNDGKIFIFKFRKVYQLHYSKNAGFYLSEFDYLRIDNKKTPYTLRGRFVAYNYKSANELLVTTFGESYANMFN